MSLEENKALMRRYYESAEYIQHNVDLVVEFVAPNFVDHTNKIDGRESLREFGNMLDKGFPDLHWTTEDIVAEGDKVWVRATHTGTHTGEFRGLAPTGKKLTEPYVHIYRILNGKVVECWAVVDELDFLKQIGAIEYTEKGKKLFPEDE